MPYAHAPQQGSGRKEGRAESDATTAKPVVHNIQDNVEEKEKSAALNCHASLEAA